MGWEELLYKPPPKKHAPRSKARKAQRLAEIKAELIARRPVPAAVLAARASDKKITYTVLPPVLNQRARLHADRVAARAAKDAAKNAVRAAKNAAKAAAEHIRGVALYVLRDPDTGDVRYVGQTTNPQVRLRTHIINPGKPIKAWMGKITSAPRMQVLAWYPHELITEAESTCIALCLENGVDLLNR